MFVNRLEEEAKLICNRFEWSKNMIFGKEDRRFFESAKCCWICVERFEESYNKVRDHCHLTGKFRGIEHNSCYVKYRKPKFIPTVLHNLSGYDVHLFIKSLGVSDGDIDCMPTTRRRTQASQNRS